MPFQVCFSVLIVCRPRPASHAHFRHRHTSGFNSKDNNNEHVVTCWFNRIHQVSTEYTPCNTLPVFTARERGPSSRASKDVLYTLMYGEYTGGLWVIYGPCTWAVNMVVYTAVYMVHTRPVFTGGVHGPSSRVECTQPNTAIRRKHFTLNPQVCLENSYSRPAECHRACLGMYFLWKLPLGKSGPTSNT